MGSTSAASSEPSFEQIRLLNAIWENFRRESKWPSYYGIDQVMDREGSRARSLIESMPPGLMLPDVASMRIQWFPRRNDELRVQVAGLRYCQGTEEDLDLLARLVRYFADRERSSVLPSLSDPQPFRVTSEEVARDLDLTDEQIARVYHLLDAFEWRIRGSGGGDPEQWAWEIDVEEVRRYRRVENRSDYLAVRLEAESEGQKPLPRLPATRKGTRARPRRPASLAPAQEAPGRLHHLFYNPWVTTVGGGLAVAAIIAVVHLTGAGSLGHSRPTTSLGSTNAHQPIRGRIETAGGLLHTWSDYNDAGGRAGPLVTAFRSIRVSCRTQGFRVKDGNVWWYRIAAPRWKNRFYASADGFYNNGATSGPLRGTPFVDPSVPLC